MQLPTKYTFRKEFRFCEILNIFSHRRLSHFIRKGTSCKKCGINCDRLIEGIDNKGHVHIDLYDQNLTTFLTIGHIVPKSCGGSRGKNIRPLCNKCNSSEGSGFDHILLDRNLFENHCYGFLVKRKSGKRFQDGKKCARIIDIFRSDRDQRIYFVFDGGFTYEANKVIFTTQRVLTKEGANV